MNIVKESKRTGPQIHVWLCFVPSLSLWGCLTVLVLNVIILQIAKAGNVLWISGGLLEIETLLATICCFWRACKTNQTERFLWMLLAVSTLIRLCASCLAGIETTVWHLPLHQTHPSDFLFFSWTLPLVLALGIPTDSERDNLFYWASGIQIIVLLILFFDLVFGGIPFSSAHKIPLSDLNAYVIFNIENFLIVVGVGLRWWSKPTLAASRRFFLVLFWTTLFYATGELIYCILEYFQSHAPWNYLWLLSVSELALILMVAYPPPIDRDDARSPKREIVAVVLDHVTPIALPIAIGVISVLTARHHLFLSVISVGVSLSVFAIYTISIQMRYRRVQVKMASVQKHLHDLALRDPLTGIGNRRGYDNHIENAWARSLRQSRTFALLVIDIDYFKALNDIFGHHEGDLCLRAVSHALASMSRNENDYIARYGGEEFVVTLHDIDAGGAMKVADRIRRAVEALGLRNRSPAGSIVTVSIGISLSEEASSPAELFQLADEALYKAKDEGRNRICYRDNCFLSA